MQPAHRRPTEIRRGRGDHPPLRQPPDLRRPPPPTPQRGAAGEGDGKPRGRGGRDDKALHRTAAATAAGKAPCAGLPSPAPLTTAAGLPALVHMTASPAPTGGGAQAKGEGNTQTHGKQETRSRAGRRAQRARHPGGGIGRGRRYIFFSARRGHGGSMPPRTRTPPATKAGQTPTLRRVPRHPARRRKAGRAPPATSGMRAVRNPYWPRPHATTAPTYGGAVHGKPPRSGSRDGARREGACARPTDPDARGGGGGAGLAPNAGGTHAGGARGARGGGG